MTLEPKLPPGRANRKALRFSTDIHRLRNAGYTFSAIRNALLDAGVEVSLTTIKREAGRHRSNTVIEQRSGPTQAARSIPVAGPAILTTPSPISRGATGREIAEAFFNANPSNPLFPAKESS